MGPWNLISLCVLSAFLFECTMAASLPPVVENMFPSCALDCVATALRSEPLISQDLNSLCRHPRIEKELWDCVRGSCNFPDQQIGKVNFELCKDLPTESKVVMAIIVLGLLGVFTNTMVGLRLYTRAKLTKGIHYDDHLIIAATAVLVYVQVSGTIDVIAFGLGRHTFNVDPKFHVFNLGLYWSDEISYQIVITLTKSSILLFYLRIFPKDRFRHACYGMLGLTSFTGLGFLLVTILQCMPVRGVFDKSIPSNCLDVNSLTYASSGVSIFIDFTILMMPIPQLIALRVPRSQRNSVLFLFSFGLIASVISIARLPFIIQYGKTTDPLFDNIGPGIWTVAEMESAIIAACLPTLKPLATKLLPRYFSEENTKKISNSPQHVSPATPKQAQMQQRQRGPRGGHSSQEFNYLFSQSSESTWRGDDAQSQRRLSTQDSHIWVGSDVESQRRPENCGSERTHETQGTYQTERTQQMMQTQDIEDLRERQDSKATHPTEAAFESQGSGRQYFDLQNGKIVKLSDRFSALSVGFVSKYLEGYWETIYSRSEMNERRII